MVEVQPPWLPSSAPAFCTDSRSRICLECYATVAAPASTTDNAPVTGTGNVAVYQQMSAGGPAQGQTSGGASGSQIASSTSPLLGPLILVMNGLVMKFLAIIAPLVFTGVCRYLANPSGTALGTAPAEQEKEMREFTNRVLQEVGAEVTQYPMPIPTANPGAFSREVARARNTFVAQAPQGVLPHVMTFEGQLQGAFRRWLREGLLPEGLLQATEASGAGPSRGTMGAAGTPAARPVRGTTATPAHGGLARTEEANERGPRRSLRVHRPPTGMGGASALKPLKWGSQGRRTGTPNPSAQQAEAGLAGMEGLAQQHHQIPAGQQAQAGQAGGPQPFDGIEGFLAHLDPTLQGVGPNDWLDANIAAFVADGFGIPEVVGAAPAFDGDEDMGGGFGDDHEAEQEEEDEEEDEAMPDGGAGEGNRGPKRDDGPPGAGGGTGSVTSHGGGSGTVQRAAAEWGDGQGRTAAGALRTGEGGTIQRAAAEWGVGQGRTAAGAQGTGEEPVGQGRHAGGGQDTGSETSAKGCSATQEGCKDGHAPAQADNGINGFPPSVGASCCPQALNGFPAAMGCPPSGAASSPSQAAAIHSSSVTAMTVAQARSLDLFQHAAALSSPQAAAVPPVGEKWQARLVKLGLAALAAVPASRAVRFCHKEISRLLAEGRGN